MQLKPIALFVLALVLGQSFSFTDGTTVPSGLLFLSSTGSCPWGSAEDTSYNGRSIIGTTIANGNVGTTGGVDNITPAGTNDGLTFTGGSNSTNNVSAGTPAGTNQALTFTGSALSSHSHGVGTYDNAAASAGTPAGTNSAPAFTGTLSTTIVNHTHGFTDLRGAATGGATTNWNISTAAADTSSTASTLLTGNPSSGGAANYTPAGTVAAPVFTGSALATHDHTFSGSSESITAGTPAGTINTPTFTGNALGTHGHTVTPTGTINTPAFTGTQFDNRSAFIRVIVCKVN